MFQRSLTCFPAVPRHSCKNCLSTAPAALCLVSSELTRRYEAVSILYVGNSVHLWIVLSPRFVNKVQKHWLRSFFKTITCPWSVRVNGLCELSDRQAAADSHGIVNAQSGSDNRMYVWYEHHFFKLTSRKISTQTTSQPQFCMLPFYFLSIWCTITTKTCAFSSS